jgi:hypothetical protein
VMSIRAASSWLWPKRWHNDSSPQTQSMAVMLSIQETDSFVLYSTTAPL